MSVDTFAFEFIDEVKRLNEIEHVAKKLSDTAKEAGFDAFCMTGTPRHGEGLDGYLLAADVSDVWLKRYMDKKYVEQDPVIEHIRTSLEPFAWRTAYKKFGGSQPAAQVMDEAESFGLRDGLCVPIFSSDGFQGMISYGGENSDFDSKIEGAMHLISIYAYNRIHELRFPRPIKKNGRSKLSKREIECLKWTSNGKTSWEIGRILNISEHTVNWYLSSVARKLDATNRPQAVAEGFRAGFLN